MDGHFIAENVKNDLHTQLELVEQLLRLQIGQNLPAPQAALLNQIAQGLQPHVNEPQREADNLTFVVPQRTYDGMIARLAGSVQFTQGVHYREINGIMYENTNNGVFNMIPPKVAGHEARLAMPAEANEQAIAAKEARVTARQRADNTVAIREQPVWALLQRQGPNNSRLEDALIEYLDTNRTQIHWYAVIRNLKQMGDA